MGTGTVFVLSLRHGCGPLLTRRDMAALIGAGIGLWFWYHTRSAALTLATAIGVSLIGGSLTIAKAYRAPKSETMLTWALGLTAAGFAALSVYNMSWALLAYPVYMIAMNGGILLAILAGTAAPRRLPATG